MAESGYENKKVNQATRKAGRSPRTSGSESRETPRNPKSRAVRAVEREEIEKWRRGVLECSEKSKNANEQLDATSRNSKIEHTGRVRPRKGNSTASNETES